MVRSAVFRPDPRSGAHLAVALRANDPAPGGPRRRQRPGGARLRPSRVPVRPADPAGRPSPAALPRPLRAGLEQLSGLDLTRVRVHYDSARPGGLGALACTQGTQIEVGPGNERQLPHEGWHVVQQLQGRVAATARAKGRPADGGAAAGLNEDAGLEREAETMGAKARQLGQAAGLGAGSPPVTPSRPAGAPVFQCAKGGLEYTEDAPTKLWAYALKPFPVNVPKYQYFQIGGTKMTSFLLGQGRGGASPNADLGLPTSLDFNVMYPTDYVKLTNDVVSAEWVIERHEEELPGDTLRKRLKDDVGDMLTAREELAEAVRRTAVGHPGEVGITAREMKDVNSAGVVFIYSPGPFKGKAQITAKYTKDDTIRRINKLNASKYLTGTKVAVGEDIPRITGGEGSWLRQADLAGTTSFSTAGALLDDLVRTSKAIPRTGGGVQPRLTQNQVGLVKLMVINDAMATTQVRYLHHLGEAQEKNIQRFFPKTLRGEYVKAVARAGLDTAEFAALHAEILRTSTADAKLVFDRADPGALRTDEAFAWYRRHHGLDAPSLTAMQHAKRQLLDSSSKEVPSPAALRQIKVTVLGPDGKLLKANMRLAAMAYTDVPATKGGGHRRYAPGKVKQTMDDINTYGVGKGGSVTNVIASTKGFTDLEGDRGAVYEFREREIVIDQTGRFNIGSLSALNTAIDGIFRASDASDASDAS